MTFRSSSSGKRNYRARARVQDYWDPPSPASETGANDTSLGEVVDRFMGSILVKDEKTNVLAPGRLLKSLDKSMAESDDSRVSFKEVFKTAVLSDPIVAASAAAFAALTPNLTKKFLEVLK